MLATLSHVYADYAEYLFPAIHECTMECKEPATHTIEYYDLTGTFPQRKHKMHVCGQHFTLVVRQPNDGWQIVRGELL